MSNYRHFYNNFDASFQNALVPPPPPPPLYFIPPQQKISDKDIIEKFERKIPAQVNRKTKPNISICNVRHQIQNLVLKLNEIKEKEKYLIDQNENLTDEDWNTNLNIIEENKAYIQDLLSQINNLNIDVLRKSLIKRAAKRARLKRVRLERKREKEERFKEMAERSRKIDEHLQKIRDDIEKAKQAEESKLQADMILKETVRKKTDARKCIDKLVALVKLRGARLNTAKGRGEAVSQTEADIFEANIAKLKSLWANKLTQYESEEVHLRKELSQESNAKLEQTEREREVIEGLEQWRLALFGEVAPQANFAGNLDQFVAVRSAWDQYLSADGSPLPVGWVIPSNLYTH